MNLSRDKILNNIREAVKTPSQLTAMPEGVDERIKKGLTKITPETQTLLREQFKKELELLSGEFHFVKNCRDAARVIIDSLVDEKQQNIAVTGEPLVQEIANHLSQNEGETELVHALQLDYPDRKEVLAGIHVSVIGASFAIADIGSLVLLYDESTTSLPHFLSDCVFGIVSQKNLVENQFELLKRIPSEKAKNMVFMAGASRTADIEKILILGAHGPRRWIVIMIEE